jgi:hypothetical protein
MNRARQAMFERFFERLYKEYCEAGMSPETAREKAADDAWAEYDRYCDEKLDERKTDKTDPVEHETLSRMAAELSAIAAALGIGKKI